MAKRSTTATYLELHQVKARVHSDVNDALDADTEALGGGRGAKGSIIRASLGLWLAIPASIRRKLIHPWSSTAPSSRINAQLDSIWPTRIIRAAARIKDDDRELIIECMERANTAREMVRELEKRAHKGAR